MPDTENCRVYPRIVAVAEEENCYQIATMRIQNNSKQTNALVRLIACHQSCHQFVKRLMSDQR